MKEGSTTGGRSKNRLAKTLAVFFLIFSLNAQFISSAFAETDSSSTSEVVSDQGAGSTTTNVGATLFDLPLLPHVESSPEKANIDESTTTSPVASTVEKDRGPPPSGESFESQPKEKTKFKKDLSLSVDAELDKVKQHLVDSGLPQNIIDRVDAYKQQQSESPKKTGLIQRIFDYFTGNSDEAKARKNAEKLANKQPFKVQGFSGKINKVTEDQFNTIFSGSKEQGNGLLQKANNLLKNGTLYNSNFDNSKNNKPLSWLAGQEANAFSNNPNDYLAAGDEVVFSQAVKDLADKLNNDPLAMLNYVRNNVEYVPYYGSKKGSDATLIERAGNDTDQASLLIAMLRYSNIPARYRQVDAKMDVGEVTDLLGVYSAEAAAQILTLNNVPYLYFVDSNNNPLFFVVEHTYVEVYMPYGYSRGANPNDGGVSQWVPMDPSINAYYYEQPVDIIGGMKANGFDVTVFFDQYLQNNYGTSSPYDAFKSVVTDYLANSSPSSTFEDAVVRVYPKQANLEFIPGTLPYQVVVDLNTYDYIPSSLRHTVQFTVSNDQENTILDYTAYVSDLADKELLVTYDPATQADQDTLNTFDSMYDVVPLSLVAVTPKIKVNGVGVASSTVTSTLGQPQSYSMIFKAPARSIGDPVAVNTVDTQDLDIITGNTNAIAINTDRVVPPETRPSADTQTTSFVSSQMLYKSALDYIYRLDQTERDLAKIVGADFTHQATRAAVFNGISVTYSNGEPYSFDWKGLRIDSSAKVNYFNRFDDDTMKYKKEFMAVFGLQASLDESNIFEDNFNVESISTVKGIKLVTSSTFPGVSLHKITAANENDIDSLSVSSTTKTIFHTAVQAGKTVYTPSAPFTYGNWTGLVYITINYDNGISGYIIGEGLNGGYTVYTVEQWPSGLGHMFRGWIVGLTAQIYSPTENSQYKRGQPILWRAYYSTNFLPVTSWEEARYINSTLFDPGVIMLKSGYGTGALVNINILDSDYPDLSFVDNPWVHEDGDRFGAVVDQIKDIVEEDDHLYWDDVANVISGLSSYEKGILLENTISLIGSSLPYLGDASDAYALFLKEDMFTQQELDDLSRTVSGVALFVPILSSKAIKISKPIFAAARLGKNGETFIKVINNFVPGIDEEQKVFRLGSKGLRYVDVFKKLEDGRFVAIESKVGRVSATSFVRKQIDKDIELLKSGRADFVKWTFTKSGITGKSGPTAGLKAYLESKLLINNISSDKFIFDYSQIDHVINP